MIPLGAQVSLPRDADGFVRRECPSCERTFKMRPLASDSFSVHAFLARQAGQANADELWAEVEVLTCLHCGHVACADEWLTDEQQQFLAELADSLTAFVRYEQLAFVRRTLRDNPRPTFIALEPDPWITQMETEPNDLSFVPFSCCGLEVKASLLPRAEPFCPRCGIAPGRRQTEPSDAVPTAVA